MAVPRPEMGAASPDEDSRSWWVKLGIKGQRFFVGATIFVLMWCVVAIPPFFSRTHQILFCSRYNCSLATPSQFALGEIVLALVLLGLAAVFFVLAHEGRRTEALDPRDY